jgi:hypothetical protein
MKKNVSTTGFTMVEVMVAFVLASILLLGIVTIDTSLDNASRNYGQRYAIKADAQVMLNHILQNAALAVGSASVNDEGIISGFAGGGGGVPANTFCIHQAAGNTILTSKGDNHEIWLCYSFVPASFQLNWCAETYNSPLPPNPPSADPRGATDCATASGGGKLIAGTTVSLLGSVFSITPTYKVFAATGQSQFTVQILDCSNNADATCNNTGTSTSLEGNPEIQITGSVIPLQASGVCNPPNPPYC